MAPKYNGLVVGEWKLTTTVMCDDGQVRTVSIEEFEDGFMAILTKGTTPVSNRIRYATSRKAINAACKW